MKNWSPHELTKRTKTRFSPELRNLMRLLPAWAKVTPSRGIGDKVAAFYRQNEQVVTDMSIVVGTEEWRLTQEDPFRAAHLHLFEKYGWYADEFEALIESASPSAEGAMTT